jgi:predicted AlkP superfamily phosphohydrolase/phosphomutase
VKPINGYVVTDFLTPSTKSQYTHPPELKEEVERISGGYVLDVEDFRTPDKEALLRRVYAKTEKHFRVAKHLMQTKPWDFFMLVEMGVDRIHHGFWSYMDPMHPKYQAGNPFEHAIRDSYRFVDREVGELIGLAPSDTVVMVVSDHGAKKMDGGICFAVNGVPPDLIVYFGDLHWRSVGSVGLGSIYTLDNDTGPDEANHDWHGLFIMNEVRCEHSLVEPGYKEGLRLYAIGATIVNLFGLPADPHAVGRSLTRY